jgi:hypothetical protein
MHGDMRGADVRREGIKKRRRKKKKGGVEEEA